MAARLETELVLAALEMAIQKRRPRKVVHHSDHGTQYTSVEFGKRCREAGVTLSMGSVGDCYEGALCESFFATLECELMERRKFEDRDEARREVFEFIEGWYNPRRRHSALGYVSPAEFERRQAREETWKCREETVYQTGVSPERSYAGAGTGKPVRADVSPSRLDREDRGLRGQD